MSGGGAAGCGGGGAAAAAYAAAAAAAAYAAILWYGRLTHAHTPKSSPLKTPRLLLWGGNNPSFPTFSEFQSKFLKGDLSLMETLAVAMKQTGAYVARSLSWEGAEFELVTMPLSPEHKAIYGQCSKFFLDLKEELEGAIKTAGEGGGKGREGGKGNPMNIFWGLQQRFFRDVLNAMKVLGEGGVVSMVKQALADG
jgi:hypothetical protein